MAGLSPAPRFRGFKGETGNKPKTTTVRSSIFYLGELWTYVAHLRRKKIVFMGTWEPAVASNQNLPKIGGLGCVLLFQLCRCEGFSTLLFFGGGVIEKDIPPKGGPLPRGG